MNVFNESVCQIALPGLAHSCEYQVKLVRNEKGQSSEMGIAISGAVLCAHTAELLLKYKLDQEGKTFKQIHDLHKLYLLLSYVACRSRDTVVLRMYLRGYDAGQDAGRKKLARR